MKKLIVIFAIILIPIFSLSAQESINNIIQSVKSTDSSAITNASKKGKGKKNNSVKGESCEVDCKTGETCRMKDKFIDADGDGINDMTPAWFEYVWCMLILYT